jgi:hypothetical protein
VLCAVIAMYRWSAPTEMSSAYISHDWTAPCGAPAGLNDFANAPCVLQRFAYSSSRDDVATAAPGSDIGPKILGAPPPSSYTARISY